MSVTQMRHESEARSLDVFARDEPCTISELSTADEAEVFEFLSARTIHTVFMASLIRDNGLVSHTTADRFTPVAIDTVDWKAWPCSVTRR